MSDGKPGNKDKREPDFTHLAEMVIASAIQTGTILGITYVFGLFVLGIPQADVETFIGDNQWVGWTIVVAIFSLCLFVKERRRFLSRSAYDEKVREALSRFTDREAKREAERRFKAGERANRAAKKK